MTLSNTYCLCFQDHSCVILIKIKTNNIPFIGTVKGLHLSLRTGLIACVVSRLVALLYTFSTSVCQFGTTLSWCPLVNHNLIKSPSLSPDPTKHMIQSSPLTSDASPTLFNHGDAFRIQSNNTNHPKITQYGGTPFEVSSIVHRCKCSSV